MIRITHKLVEKLIRVHDAKLEKIELWEETVEENQLTISQSLTDGTSCSNKKGKRKESKEIKPKSLAHSESTSKPDAVKLPSMVKPLSHSNSTSKPKSKTIQDGSNDSDDQLKGSLSQRTVNLPNVSEEDFEVEAALITIAKTHPHCQAVPKASYINTIVLSSEEEEPSEAEMGSVSEYS
ncbi:hypothetical protein L0F63_007128, partial [Massospora cicadina]